MAWLKGPRGSGNYIEVNEPVRFMQAVQSLQDNPYGDIWYVDGTLAATGDGKAPSTAFLTLTEAVAAADDYDWISIAPDTYEEAAKIDITQTGLKIIGSTVGGHHGAYGGCGVQVNVDNYDNNSWVGLDIEANSVEIMNISFTQWSANAAIYVAPGAAGVNVYGTHIHDCAFNMGMVDSAIGVDMGTVSTDAPGTLIERCAFYEIAGSSARGVVLNGSASSVIDSFFWCGTAGVGIEDARDFSGTSRPRRRVINCDFETSDSTNARGVKMTQASTAGYVFIHGCSFVNFADDGHCITTVNGLTGVNYNCSSTITAVKV